MRISSHGWLLLYASYFYSFFTLFEGVDKKLNPIRMWEWKISSKITYIYLRKKNYGKKKSPFSNKLDFPWFSIMISHRTHNLLFYYYINLQVSEIVTFWPRKVHITTLNNCYLFINLLIYDVQYHSAVWHKRQKYKNDLSFAPKSVGHKRQSNIVTC
jgi:hypothetical protein